MSAIKYEFRATIWKYKGPAGWYFVTLPKLLSKRIRKDHGLDEEGWGRLKAQAKIGKSQWQTAIWYDSKFNSYLLPIKAAVRKRELLEEGTRSPVQLNLKRIDPRLRQYIKP